MGQLSHMQSFERVSYSVVEQYVRHCLSILRIVLCLKGTVYVEIFAGDNNFVEVQKSLLCEIFTVLILCNCDSTVHAYYAVHFYVLPYMVPGPLYRIVSDGKLGRCLERRLVE